MKKRALLAVLLVLAVVGLLAVGAFLALGPLLRAERGASFHAPGVLAIDLDTAVVERTPPDLFGQQVLGDHQDLLDLSLALDRAADDDRIAGVWLKLGSGDYGWAKEAEIADRLGRFRKSGKFVYAWTELTDEKGYATALSADSIWVMPGGGMEMNGFQVRSPYLRDLLAKVGLEPEIVAFGEYKSAPDVFRRTGMSDADREATTALLDGVYGRFVDAVTAARGIDRARLEDALANGVYLAPDLEDLGLIDGTLDESEVLRTAVGRALGVDPADVSPEDLDDHLIDVRDYAADLPRARGRSEGTIGLVYATGTITSGESGFDPVFGQTMGAETVVRMLRDVAEDGDLDAVVLRIDSPGGDALASEKIWDAVEDVRAEVPVVVSMSDLAASGGYYVAAAGDSIVAEPLTLTGSIGVFAVLFDASGLWKKLGIAWDGVETGPAADFPPTDRPMTEAEMETFRGLVEHTYRTFLDRVSEGRGMSVEQVEPVARGRVWTGSAAAERGLVDEVGGLETAFRMAKGMAGIDPDARVDLHVYPKREGFLDRLRDLLRLRGLESRVAGDARVRAAAESPAVSGLLRRVPGIGVLALSGAARVLAVLPWIPEAR